jgi:hypothetical protein
MALFAITFRLDQDSTYAERYKSVTQAIAKQDTSNKHWSEPTSFFLITSSLNSKGLAEAIDANSSFANDRDLLLVINLTKNGYHPIGLVKDKDLYEIMKLR